MKICYTQLYINMRTGEGEKDFAEWLLKLGNGGLKVEFGEDIIKIPDECIV